MSEPTNDWPAYSYDYREKRQRHVRELSSQWACVFGVLTPVLAAISIILWDKKLVLLSLLTLVVAIFLSSMGKEIPVDQHRKVCE